MSKGQQRRQFLAKGLTLGTALIVAEVGLPKCVRAALAGETPPASPGPQKEKGLEELAYCGCDCQGCDLYKATRDNNMRVKEEFCRNWEKNLGVKIKPEDAACDGCRSTTGRLGYHCGNVCDVRKCGLSRGVKSCAVCADFPSCEKELWKKWPAMHERTKDRHKRLS
jgi:hypothetical protein